MKAQEIMTRDVISVRPDTSVRDIAALMVGKHISGVPVLTDSGDIVGMVSQSELCELWETWDECAATTDPSARVLTMRPSKFSPTV